MAKDIVFVIGMGRSGTSAMSRLLSLCGGTLPESLVGPHENNPKGHWEPTEALDLNDRFLHANTSNWFDPAPGLSAAIDLRAPACDAFIAEAAALLRSWPQGRFLVIKEPRITAIAPLWFEAARQEGFRVKVVIPVRDPAEIAKSLAARDGMSQNHAALLTLKYNFFAERFSRDVPRVFVTYQNLLADWRREVVRIEQALELDLSGADAAAIDSFLTPDLRRQRRAPQDAPAIEPAALQAVYDAFTAAAIDQKLDLAALDRLYADYVAYGAVWPEVAETFLMHFRNQVKLQDRNDTFERQAPQPAATADRAAPPDEAAPLGGGAMSPVIDRPDRKLFLRWRARGLAHRVRLRRNLGATSFRLAVEFVRAKLADFKERHHGEPRILRVVPGDDVLAPSASVAIFVHYAPTPTVSSMVLSQLESYRALGFRILFVSMAPRLPDFVLRQVTSRTALVVQRRNIGIDFGAWQDMLPFLEQGTGGALRELLLVNDSVCGPLSPLEPIVTDMRAAGAGFFGMTENLAPRPHLQSYFLLARGEAAIADLTTFLTRYRQTAYKRQVIRRGEVAVTSWMRAQGHVVAARFGYEPVEKAALESPIARTRLCALFPSLFAGLPKDQQAAYAQRLQHYPLNPAHSLWRELVELCGFPFLKTELLLRNPGGVTDMETWRLLMPAQRRETIETHLALMRQAAADT